MNIKNVIISIGLVRVCRVLFYQQSTAQELKKQIDRHEQTITQLEKNEKETYIKELPKFQEEQREKDGQVSNE